MKKSFRTFAIVLTMLFVAAACGGKQEEAQRTTGQYGSGVDLDVDGDKKKAAQATAAPAQGGTSGGQQAPTEGQGNTGSSGGSGFQPDISRKAQDGGNAGENAFFYLNRKVPKLVVEIDAVSGNAPSSEAISLLKQRLGEHVDKPGGVQVLPVGQVRGQRKDVYSDADIAALEEANRQTHNSPEVASMYILYVNGEPSREGPIGVAYRASSVVIYIEKIRGLAAGGLFSTSALEKGTLIHEIGHLLALVNQTYRSPRDHEDPEHPGHSKNPDSVMYWALETTDVVNALAGQDIPADFDADDKADLADLKSGKLG